MSTAAERTHAPSKPHFAYFLATAGGLGYLQPGPGTWGSLAGAGLYFGLSYLTSHWLFFLNVPGRPTDIYAAPVIEIAIPLLLALVGIWAAGRVASFCGERDPQFVVIDEVFGQYLTLVIGKICAICRYLPSPTFSQQADGKWHFIFTYGLGAGRLGWKSLLAGFILFRVFDIWKPFPIRRAERLRGGWGIMADDMLAALLAGACLWLLRFAGR